MSEKKIIKVTKGCSEWYRITVEVTTKHDWFRKSSVKEIEFEGSSTVWYYYPSGYSAGVGVDLEIVQLVKRFEMSHGKSLDAYLKDNS